MRHYLSVHTVPTTRVRQLEEAASQFLRKHGYRADGLRRGTVDMAQRRFERSSCVKTPTGGLPHRR